MKKPGGANEAYAVKSGELLLNGHALQLPERCLDLCLIRHGLEPGRNYRRLPLEVGRHVLRIANFVANLTLAREIRLMNA